jgi:hypothetical protein
MAKLASAMALALALGAAAGGSAVADAGAGDDAGGGGAGSGAAATSTGATSTGATSTGATSTAAASTAAAAAAAGRPSLVALAALADQLLERSRRERLIAAARPVPIAVRWSPRRVATLDVGGALGALIGADLDRDRVPELYAVTDQAVIVYRLEGAKVRELARLSFPGEQAPIRPRDPVATVAVDAAAGELMAGSSSYARSVRARWQGGALTVLEELDGLPLCAHQRAALVPGRNYFADSARLEAEAMRLGGDGRGDQRASAAAAVAAEWRGGKDGKDGKDAGFYGQRCRDEVPLAEGVPARVVARLGVAGPLQVTVQPRCESGCPPRRHEVTGVGVAFDVGDVDRDGRVDVAYAGAGAPGDPDAVRVVPVTDPRRTLFRRAFTGGVAAVALVDLDGDGAAEVIAAVRLPGSPRVDLWRLN